MTELNTYQKNALNESISLVFNKFNLHVNSMKKYHNYLKDHVIMLEKDIKLIDSLIKGTGIKLSKDKKEMYDEVEDLLSDMKHYFK